MAYDDSTIRLPGDQGGGTSGRGGGRDSGGSSADNTDPFGSDWPRDSDRSYSTPYPDSYLSGYERDYSDTAYQPTYPVAGSDDHDRPGTADAPPAQPYTPPVGPIRDRITVHAIWEVLLLLLVVIGTAVVYQTDSQLFEGAALRGMLGSAASLGLVALGLGLSLRAGVPNLAVASIAAAAGLLFARQSGEGLLLASLIVAAAAVGVGVLLGLLVVVFHVPSWAASLGLIAGLGAWTVSTGPQVERVATDLGYRPDRQALLWFAGFVTVSVIGGAVALIPPVRRAIGSFRPVADPAQRRGFGAAMVAFLVLVVSTVLAALAGEYTALRLQVGGPDSGGLVLLLALGAVLIGGTSAYGRRGGVLGTVLGVVGITLILQFGVLHSLPSWLGFAVAAGAIGVGLVVTRLVEFAGRGRPDDLDEAPDEDADMSWS